MQHLDSLKAEFAHENLDFVEVFPGLIKANLRFGESALVELHVQGAHVARWRDGLGQDNLFLSRKAVYSPGVAIRGGNPIIFPQFGPGDMRQHGFARHSVWQVISTSGTDSETAISLQLKPEDISKDDASQWPHDFLLTLTVTLGVDLTTELKIQNPNAYPILFTHGFHTYLAVDDIESVEISDLSGLKYMDNLRDKALFDETRQRMLIDEFIDRRYQSIPESLEIKDKSSGRRIIMTTQNCQDAFIWNPWQEAEKQMADLESGSYLKFICVEPGHMKTAVQLQAGQTLISTQKIKRQDLI